MRLFYTLQGAARTTKTKTHTAQGLLKKSLREVEVLRPERRGNLNLVY